MTDKERKEIGPELCAEGLRSILHRYAYWFDYADTAVMVGAIVLLRDKSDDYLYQMSDEEWKYQIIPQEEETENGQETRNSPAGGEPGAGH